MPARRDVKGILCLCLALLLTITVSGQDFQAVMKEVHARYRDAQKVHVVMNIKVFESQDATTPFFSDQAIVKRDGENYFYHLTSNEFLMNERYLIMVDNASRTISCDSRANNNKADWKDPMKMNLDSMLSAIGKPRYMGRTADGDHYKLAQKGSMVEEVNLYLHPEQQYMKKIEYRYREGQKVVIDVSLFDTNPTFNNETFSESMYVVADKKANRPSQAFAGYRIWGFADDKNN
jgi:hypothetical protein